jgi:hypothetical protein
MFEVYHETLLAQNVAFDIPTYALAWNGRKEVSGIGSATFFPAIPTSPNRIKLLSVKTIPGNGSDISYSAEILLC